MPEKADLNANERWALGDKPALPEFVGVSQGDSSASPVIGWILQKTDPEVEVVQS